MLRSARIALVTLTLTLVAAMRPLPVEAQVATRDSAGVRITPITIRAATGRLTISSTAVVDIGGASGGTTAELSRVRSVVRLADGTIVVANGNPQELRFFDSRGQYVRTAGRRGSGPGEFQSVPLLWAIRGDSLLTYDARAQRILLFDATGKHIATHPLMPPPGRSLGGILGVFADNALIAGSSDATSLPPRATPYYLTRHIFVYGLDGQHRADAGGFGDGEHFVQRTTPENGGVAYWDLAYGRQTTVVPRGNDLLVGDGSTLELRTYTRAGALKEILRATTPSEPLTAAEVAAYRARVLAEATPADRLIEEKRLAEMPYPKAIPAFKRFLVAGDGRIWIQRYPRVGDAKQRWVVLDARGQFVDEVTMPERFALFTAGAHYVLGVYRDGDDVEHVRQYAIAAK